MINGEARRRKDSKMTAKATENRQYRYFDSWLTDNLASRLLVVDVATKEFRDLTPKRDYLFSNRYFIASKSIVHEAYCFRNL